MGRDRAVRLGVGTLNMLEREEELRTKTSRCDPEGGS